jgi:menaquinone-dependent protoporphyrinogen IX oxidase
MSKEYLRPRTMGQSGDQMRFIVAFDSVYGNTRKVAEYVASELIKQGAEIELIDLKMSRPKDVEGDALLLGSPTRMGKMTRRSAKFAKRLDAEVWSEKPMAIFDTIMQLPEDEKKRAKALRWTANGAAIKLKALLQERGFQVSDKVLRVEVFGLKGPLTSAAEEQSRTWARELLVSLAK